MAEVVRVGIVGLGRSGWGIHTEGIAKMPQMYKVVAMHDPWAERLATSAAAVGAKAHASFDALLADRDVEMVVVASPNKFHAGQALAALKAGKHVLCEKPFGYTAAHVDAMIAAAKAAGKVIQPFQQRRYEPDFQKVKEICQSGILGQITFIRIAWHNFTRRWDWQTSRQNGGGQLYNNGPHLVDHAMELFGPAEPKVSCELRRSLCSGEAEDEVRIQLAAAGAPTIQMELTATTAFPQDRWLVCGTAGGLRGGAGQLNWKWVDWTKMPPRPLDMKSTPDRSYNSEKLDWQQAEWTPTGAADSGAGAAPSEGPTTQMYSDLYQTLRHGKPQVITPESVRRRVAVMQRCYELNGIPFPC
jgi:predicted dehydrogenase